MTLQERVARADAIVTGTVTDVRSYYTAGRRAIWSELTVDSREVLKGTRKDRYRVHVPGGRVSSALLSGSE